MLISELPSALERFGDVKARLAGRAPALFLDYDGTLTPIAGHPEHALLPEATRPVLQRLARLCPVALVSGRDVATLRRLVALDGVTYAGEHGFDILHPDGERVEPPELAALIPHLEAAKGGLRDALCGLEGAILEFKRFSVAVHYRHVVPAAVEKVRSAVAEQLERHPKLKAINGKKVFELQPALDWNKGRAVVSLMATEGIGPESLPLFLGDDITDETAFEALGGRGVCIVLEGEEDRETAAALRLADPEEVRRFLECLADLVGD